MKEKIRQFMAGRYGTDQLGRCTMAVGVISFILYMITKLSLLYLVTLACLILYYYRSMSRDCSKRYDENLKFLHFQNKITNRLQLEKLHWSQRKTHRFYSCPSCKQKIRVPRGRGKISITCPRCHAEFIRKT
ncbi:MAG: hypothetical protein PUB22_08410 [Clostridiales bacterium]|nr:hypothetical protein [Clostridiales bacterium]